MSRGCRDGVDLNRAFPDRSDSNVQPSLPIDGSEPPEVLAVARLATSLPLTGAATLHEGAVVAVVPWDGDSARQRGYSAAPDDDTFTFLARTYADAHTRMAAQKPRLGKPPSRVRPSAAPLSSSCRCVSHLSMPGPAYPRISPDHLVPPSLPPRRHPGTAACTSSTCMAQLNASGSIRSPPPACPHTLPGPHCLRAGVPPAPAGTAAGV